MLNKYLALPHSTLIQSHGFFTARCYDNSLNTVFSSLMNSSRRVGPGQINYRPEQCAHRLHTDREIIFTVRVSLNLQFALHPEQSCRNL